VIVAHRPGWTRKIVKWRQSRKRSLASHPDGANAKQFARYITAHRQARRAARELQQLVDLARGRSTRRATSSRSWIS